MNRVIFYLSFMLIANAIKAQITNLELLLTFMLLTVVPLIRVSFNLDPPETFILLILVVNFIINNCMSAIYHNPVILAITSLSKSFSPKYLLFNL